MPPSIPRGLAERIKDLLDAVERQRGRLKRENEKLEKLQESLHAYIVVFSDLTRDSDEHRAFLKYLKSSMPDESPRSISAATRSFCRQAKAPFRASEVVIHLRKKGIPATRNAVATALNRIADQGGVVVIRPGGGRKEAIYRPVVDPMTGGDKIGNNTRPSKNP